MSIVVPVRALAAVAILVAVLALPSPAQAIGFNEGNCSAGESADYSLNFFDDMESRVPGTFNHNALTGTVDAWSYPATGHASSGDTVLHADDPATTSDSVVRTPVGTAGATGLMRLRFTHTFEFESGNFDGGVVELSVNGGAFSDIGAGAYNGTIDNVGSTNPLHGRPAFVGSSSGSHTTFIAVAVAPGSTVQARFRVGTDESLGAGGWWIDDAGIYQCGTDTTAPSTTIAGSPSGTNTSRPSLTFSSDKTGVGFQCREDGGDWQRCFSTRALPPMANGSHTVDVRAVDPAGNADATPDSRTFTVSAPVPETTIASGPTTAAPSSTATPAFALSSDVPGSTFECSLDNGGFTTCPSGYTTPTLSDGPHTLAVRATDAVGNSDATPASRSFAVDTTAPETTIAAGPAAGSTTRDAKPSFQLTSPEAGAAFECKVDAGAFSPCAASWSALALSDGTHTLSFRARDAAGNVDATPALVTFTVDTTAPETSIGDGPAEGSSTSNTTPTFALLASEDGAAFECSLDGAAFAGCPPSYTTPALADGPHSLQVRATDAVGNVDGTPVVRAFRVVVATAPSGGGDVGGGGAPSAPVDRTKPKVALSGVPSTIKLKTFLKGVAGKATTDEPATLEFELRATPKKAVTLARFELLLGSRSLGLGGGTRSFTVKPSKRLVGKSKKLTVQLRVTATDAAGNTTAVTRTVKVK